MMNVYSSLRVRYRFCKILSEINILMNATVSHNNVPLSRETSKFLDFLKFREEDSVVSLKDIKAVLKASYEVLTD